MDERIRVVVEPTRPRYRYWAFERRMGRALGVAGYTALLFIAAWLGWQARGIVETHRTTVQQPRTAYLDTRLLPGQKYTVTNHDYRVVRIRSQMPISVNSSDCHASYVLDWTCNEVPSDIVISDDRAITPFTPPTGNSVSIFAREF